MDAQIVLGILATAGAVSIFMFALKGLLDQVPDVIRSWRRIMVEARRPHSDHAPEREDHRPPSAGVDGS
ncbi:hypothetical protein GCM10010377_52560 [Streptomyces viridiviolaceus]|uniref:Uncharacterized protein n=1 Tax=Streptomyces viridiviolaceus TaxID=68282 RepID=A0ABW2E590_9ACTN|nr:hypothetical protein [Streptomyces viridiviolaceus]GHB54854.1 hypothetical protein GCM10010377_52560 [Streptomyces viridiviolaceus]